MYFDLLKTIFEPKASYDIYVDIKDSQGQKKLKNYKQFYVIMLMILIKK